MARRIAADERQPNLFGWPPPAPPAPRPRARMAGQDLATAEPESVASFAERVGQADLDELVATLPDEALAHLALESARQLKRRIARAGSSRTGKAKKRLSPLERVGQGLAREWASRIGSDETW